MNSAIFVDAMNNNFSPLSRVWIYMSSSPFTDSEAKDINLSLLKFAKEWTAHGSNLKAHGEVFFKRFIVLLVDETAAGASGCSIDKSVYFIREIEKKYNVELFNRLLFAWKKEEEIHVSHLNQLRQLADSGEIDENTIVFNNAITTKQELDETWMTPLGKSWMKAKLLSQKTG